MTNGTSEKYAGLTGASPPRPYSEEDNGTFMDMDLRRQPAFDVETPNDQKFNITATKRSTWIQTPNSNPINPIAPYVHKKPAVGGLARVLGRGKTNMVPGTSTRNLLDDQSVASPAYHNETLNIDSSADDLTLPVLDMSYDSKKPAGLSKVTTRRINSSHEAIGIYGIPSSMPDSSLETVTEAGSDKSETMDFDENEKSSRLRFMTKSKEKVGTSRFASEKGSKTEKIQELLIANKELKKVVQVHQKQLLEKDRRLKELQKVQSRPGQTSGEEPTNNEKQVEALLALSSASKKQQVCLLSAESENRRTKKELEKVLKENKLLKKDLATKKKESMGLEKEINANLTVILGLRKELSQTLQQLDILEEKKDEDEGKVIALSKELTQLRSGNTYEPADISAIRDQLEFAEKHLKKKDRLIDNQRIEIADQVGQILQLKAEVEQSEGKLVNSLNELDRRQEQIQENSELQIELEEVNIALEEAEARNRGIIAEHAKDWELLEKDHKRICFELQRANLDHKASDSRSLGDGHDRRELDQMQFALAEASSKEKALMEKNEELEKENATVKSLRLELKRAEDEKDKAEETTREVVSELNVDIKKLQTSLNHSSDYCANLKSELIDFKAQNVLLQSDRDFEQKSEETTVPQALSSQSAQSTQQELISLQEGMRNLHQQNSELQAQLDVLNADRNDWRSPATRAEADELLPIITNLHNVQSEITPLRAEVDAFRAKEKNFEVLTKSLSDDRDAWKASAERVGVDLAKAQSKASLLEEVQRELAIRQSESMKYRQEKNDVERHLDELVREREAWRDSVEQSQTDYDEIQAEVLNLKSKINDLESDLNNTCRQKDEWQEVAEEKDSAMSDGNIALGNLQLEYSKLRAEAEELREHNGDFESEIKDIIQDRRELQEKVNFADIQCAGINNNLERTEKQLQQPVEECNELRFLIEDLEAQLCSILVERDDLKKSIDIISINASGASIEAQCRETNQQESIVNMQNELNDLLRRFVEVEGDLETVVTEKDSWKELAETAETDANEAHELILVMDEKLNEMSVLEKECSDLRQEKNLFTYRIDELTADRDAMDISLVRAQSILSDNDQILHNQLSNLEEALHKETKKSQTLQDIADENISLISSLQTTIQELQVSNEECLDQITTMHALEKGLRAEMSCRNDEIMDLKKRSSIDVDFISRLEATHANDKVMIEQLEINNTICATEVKKFQSSEQELRLQINDNLLLQGNLESVIEELQNENMEYAAQVEVLKNSLESARSNLSENEQTLNSQLGVLEVDLRAETKRADVLQGVITDLESQREVLQRGEQETREEVSTLKVETAELRDRISGDATIICDLEAKQVDLESVIEELETELMGTSELLSEALKSKVVMMESQTELEEKNNASLKMIEEFQSRIHNMEAMIDKITIERDVLKSSPKTDIEKPRYLITLEKLQIDHVILAEENNNMREQIVAMTRERDDLIVLVKKGSELFSQNAFLEEKLRKCSCNSDENIVECLKIQIANLQKQIERLADEREESKSDAASLGSRDSVTREGNSVSSQRAHVLAIAERKKIQTKHRWNFLASHDNESGTGSQHGGDSTNSSTAVEVNELRKEIEVLGETIRRLKSENVKLNSTMKSEIYSSNKKYETIISENTAYVLKIQTLETEMERMSSKLADIEASSSKLKIYFGTGKKTIKELEDAMIIVDRQKKFAESECEALQKDFDSMATASNIATDRLTKEIDHMKKIQGGYDDKISAMEKMVLAINQENATLREMSSYKGDSISVSGNAHACFAQDEKDVKIAQLHYELVNLRMRLDTIRHEDLKQEIIMLEKEKLQLNARWEEKVAKIAANNEEVVESLQFRLRSREETITLLEESLDVQLQKTAMAS